MSNGFNGIDKNKAHEKAVALIPETFFWSSIDDLAPFGSDEGYTALVEYREWRMTHPDCPTLECLQWVIESVGEMTFADYNENLLSPQLIAEQIADDDFDDQQYIYTLDVSIIATGFGQLVDEGNIDAANKRIIRIAVERQLVWSGLQQGWTYATDYIANLEVLRRVLEQA
ncbi:hypothetical protein [Chitinophaga nivalis]|uniref:DUF4376 domain-containing protein n=1 Tax=Chitinophaga nivalis TaxID=2991709 RepID=A0ABT3IRD0_9BACT|nr:hypothetical protein [Chitinophaga nivalis]MCW3463782.1 hypothetical protein [Chitinophaga nivalis]MCW3486528.1 hypothetical protein [Chitinophaga nivalis]